MLAWTRREAALLALSALITNGAAAQPSVGFDTLSPLRAAAEKAGVFVGAATSPMFLTMDPKLAALLPSEFNMLVAEGATKWSRLHPAADRWDFSGADDLLAFATTHNMNMRGHTLIWHGSWPSWIDAPLAARQGEQLMETYIATVAGRYKGRFRSWDVVNEAIKPEDGLDAGLRKTPWLTALGPSYIARAFRLAAQADPAARLVYNDYGQEYGGRKARAILNLVRGLLDQSVPVHAVGLQAHLFANRGADYRGITDFCESAKAMGLGVCVTELDVSDKYIPDDVPLRERDEIVAREARKFLAAVTAAVKPEEIVTWGVTDKYSWLGRPDQNPGGRVVRPLPFDDQYTRKPMWSVIHECLETL